MYVGWERESLLWAAMSNRRLKTDLQHKNQDLEKVNAELKRKKEETERLKQEAAELSENVKKSEQKIQDIEQTITYTLAKSRQIQSQIASAKNDRDLMAQKADTEKEAIRQSLQTYYVAWALAGPFSPAAVFTRQALTAQGRGLQDVHRKRADFDTLLKDFTETQKTVRTEMERQETMLSSVQSDRNNKERQLEKKRSRQQIIESELAELEKTAQELASLIDNLRSRAVQEEEAEKQDRIAKQMSGESPIPRRSLLWPVQGEVVEKFGRHKHPELGTTYISNGIIINLKQSQPVRAAADGRILYTGKFMSYGQMALMEHPGDWYTVYGRLSKFFVEKGQELKAGDVLGESGLKPGGAETYFELRFYGKPTDPLPWMKE